MLYLCYNRATKFFMLHLGSLLFWVELPLFLFLLFVADDCEWNYSIAIVISCNLKFGIRLDSDTCERRGKRSF